jgi:hypothetical protein
MDFNNSPFSVLYLHIHVEQTLKSQKQHHFKNCKKGQGKPGRQGQAKKRNKTASEEEEE